jgi:hypothetical protein
VEYLRIKKGNPWIENYFGPGIFVFPDRPFIYYEEKSSL